MLSQSQSLMYYSTPVTNHMMHMLTMARQLAEMELQLEDMSYRQTVTQLGIPLTQKMPSMVQNKFYLREQ